MGFWIMRDGIVTRGVTQSKSWLVGTTTKIIRILVPERGIEPRTY